ncbi:MAG: hypothetical protein P8079_03490 [Gammaproteobacteria bacterium]
MRYILAGQLNPILMAAAPVNAATHVLFHYSHPAGGAVAGTAPASVRRCCGRATEPSFCKVLLTAAKGKHVDNSGQGRLAFAVNQAITIFHV